MRAYIFQTWVARGSSLASCSGSAAVSRLVRYWSSGEPDIRGDVNGLVALSEREDKISSEKISVKMVDFVSAEGEAGVVGDWVNEARVVVEEPASGVIDDGG